ncbi:MAG: alkaline phosphatase family protein, partial [Bdellovibrio sp.]|nr:alkaline phosphatase family protein [Bdellovibrio sp.]
MFKMFFLCAFLLGNLAHAADSSTGQRFKKVLIIVLENTDYDEALKQPFLKKAASQGALLEKMNGLTHPSQGNYLAMIGGDSFQVKNDDPVNLRQQNLIDLLEKRGLSWKGYMENYPGNCFTGATKGRYVRKHNPFISFDNISSDPNRCANIQDLKAFAQDA